MAGPLWCEKRGGITYLGGVGTDHEECQREMGQATSERASEKRFLWHSRQSGTINLAKSLTSILKEGSIIVSFLLLCLRAHTILCTI